MSKKKELYSVLRKIRIYVSLMCILYLNACFDKPDEFVAPTWDAEINIPITSKRFDLLEIVEKDSSLLKASEDVETLGLIYFGDSQSITSINIEDDLKISGFNTEFSEQVGQIKVNVPIPAASEIRVEDWTTEVVSGSYQVFPEQEGDVSIDIVGVETVESILIDEGDLTVFVVNRLPVEIVLRGMTIRNKHDGSLVAEKSATIVDEWIVIPPLDVDSVSFNIDNKIVTNSLEYQGTIWSGGSGGEEVLIPEEAGTTVLALFRNLVIGSATGQLPSQNFNIDGFFVIDDSTQIEEAIIEEGRAVININNYLDLNVSLSVLFDNLFDENNNQFELNIDLSRREVNRTVNLTSLKDWKIATPTPGIPTNELSYSIVAVTDSTNEISTITKNDSVSFEIVFDELIFNSIRGKLKPTYINLDDSGFKLDYGNIDQQAKFGELNFQDAVIIMNLNSSSDIKIRIDGELKANNGIRTNNKLIEDIIIPSDDPAEIDILELINGFTFQLPDSFSLNANAVLNPFYEIVEIEMQDSIYGNVEFEIPLNVGISEGSFTDTFDVDFGDVDEDDIDRLNYGELTFTITNSVPVSLSVSASVLDHDYIEVLYLPTSYNQIEYIEVPQPEVSEIGETLMVGTKTQTITIFGDDIKQLLNNPYMMMEVKFNTAGENNNPVKFKTTNEISFDIRLSAEYRVEL